MSERTYAKLSAVGQKRARIVFWAETVIGAALMSGALAIMYFALRAFLWSQI